MSTSIPKLTEDISKIPDSGTSPWNTLGIPENTSGLNFLSLNEEESNSWTSPVTGRLISPSGTPNTKLKTPSRGEDIEDLLDKLLKNPYKGDSNLRFRPDIESNPFHKPISEQIPILSTFPTWKSTDDVYYYNILKNKGPAKRKVTFGQTITTSLSNLLSEKQPRYQTRYQMRNNNLPEKLLDDDNDDDNSD